MGVSALVGATIGSAIIGGVAAQRSKRAQIEGARIGAQAQTAALGQAGEVITAATEKRISGIRETTAAQIAVEKQTAAEVIKMQKEMYGEIMKEFMPYNEVAMKAVQFMEADAYGGETSPLYLWQSEKVHKALDVAMGAGRTYDSGQAIYQHGEAEAELAAREAERKRGVVRSLAEIGTTGQRVGAQLGTGMTEQITGQVARTGERISGLMGLEQGTIDRAYADLAEFQSRSATEGGRITAQGASTVAGARSGFAEDMYETVRTIPTMLSYQEGLKYSGSRRKNRILGG